mgnify:CR=1 FL=1
MVKRRTFLTGVVSGLVALSGCSESSGDTTVSSTPQSQTLSPLPKTTSASSSATTEAAQGTPSSQSPGTTQTATPTPEPTIQFHAQIDSISKCGRTCRSLKYTVQNQGLKSANDVSVDIKVFTGGEEVYDTTQSIEDVTKRTELSGITHTIDVGIGGGSKIKGNDGQVTIKITPRSADGTSDTFSFDRTLDV